MKRNVKIIISILAVILVAGLGTLFVNLGSTWFNTLLKPSQWIPNFVIPVIWTIIYIAFITILTLWWLKEYIPFMTVILLIINGVLNTLWCLVFFTLKQTFLGNIVIILNLIAGFWLVIDILRRKKTYGYILLIYPVWLSIATMLNLAIWILN